LDDPFGGREIKGCLMKFLFDEKLMMIKRVCEVGFEETSRE